ncbi:DUF1036 domain-containing protein [Oceanicola sp. 502str15]|uniref:DUF1036 domain-containing protein n=1 Tax=Oceanicola sp. 502str15 TaxID=2696061 RepID=UPI0020951585|nr:DUF1036 domain-containing protein [Oceanicola sp. 502str15]MCO6382629.1 DUF1036 domain-containing protein [Oceanicola sp. 502str15]
MSRRLFPRTAVFSLLASVASLLGAGAARAEFAVCNQSFDVINVAIGQLVDSQFQTEGWWTIGTNQCANVIKNELNNRYIYVYATDVFGQPILDGSVSMCIAAKAFEIEGIESCWDRGHRAAMFHEVDTQATVRWTLFITPPGGG